MADDPGLRELLKEASGAAVFGVDGEGLDLPDLGVPSSPTLLVAPIADALKTLSEDGFVTGSLDRGDMWRVVGYHLDEKTSHRLAQENIDISQIHQEVVRLGLAWQVLSVDDLA